MTDREALRAAVLKVLPVDPHDGEAVLAITKNDEPPSALGQPLGIDMDWGDPGVLADAIVDAVIAVWEQDGNIEWAYRYPNGHVATWIPQLMTEDLARSVVAEHPDLLTVVCRRVTRWEDTDDRST